jgi:hypothetical protein
LTNHNGDIELEWDYPFLWQYSYAGIARWISGFEVPNPDWMRMMVNTAGSFKDCAGFWQTQYVAFEHIFLNVDTTYMVL